MSTETDFNAAYWLSQPPPVQALQGQQQGDALTEAATNLAIQGYVIDVPIMVWCWDPFQVMTLRQQYGYTWVPSALQPNVAIAPGLGSPSAPPYDPNNPPAASIKVSTNIADYPPYKAPTAPVSTVPTVLVGAQSLGSMYLTVTGDHSPDGTTYSDGRGTFVKHVIQTPFGYSAYWKKVG